MCAGKTSLYKCVQSSQASPSFLTEQQPMCGVLQSGLQLQPAIWTCKVYHGFAIYVDFLTFYLPWSTNCAKASLYLTYSDTITFHYCGKRQPWYIGIDASLLQIQYKQLSYTYRGFHFSLTYEAVDIKSPLVSVTQISHLALDVAYQVHFLTFGNVYSYSAYIAESFLLMANQLSVVCIKLMTHFEFMVFDGPGILSPVITANNFSNSTVCFTGFLGYLVSKSTFDNKCILNKISSFCNVVHKDK